jgi:hypothetical protein
MYEYRESNVRNAPHFISSFSKIFIPAEIWLAAVDNPADFWEYEK